MTDNEKLIEEADKAYFDVRAKSGPGTGPLDAMRAALAVFEKAHTPTDEREMQDVAARMCGCGSCKEWLAESLRRSEVPEPCAGCGHVLHALNGGECWVIVAEVNDGPIYCPCGRAEPQVIERHDLVMPIYEEPEPSAAHEFDEDVDDCSMCMCGVPADQHWRVEPQGEPSDALCGDWPAPCNCETPETHDGSVPTSLVREERAEPSDAQVEAALQEWWYGDHEDTWEAKMRAALRAAGGVR